MTNIGYVDLTYADEYVTQHYTSADDLRYNWQSLDDPDKEALLRRSFEAIESVVFSGRKYSPGQPNAFPRWPEKEIPDAIMAAQVENAVALADSSASEDAAFYEKLWQFGVESYSIGNLSEKTSSGAWGRNLGTSNGIISARAIRLLKPYTSGGYNIRGWRK